MEHFGHSSCNKYSKSGQQSGELKKREQNRNLEEMESKAEDKIGVSYNGIMGSEKTCGLFH